MNTATITAIILSTFGALFLGMAALIKGMVIGKLDDLRDSVDAMRNEVHDTRNDLHKMDIRVTRIEAQERFYPRTSSIGD